MSKVGFLIILTLFAFTSRMAMVESSSTTEAESEPEVTSAEPEGTETEPESESESGSSSTEPEGPNVVAERRPSLAEFMMPPFILIFLIYLALGSLMVTAQYRKFMHNHKLKQRGVGQAFTNAAFAIDTENGNVNAPKKPPGSSFLSREDEKTIESLDSFFNQPMQLLKISLPAVLSLAFCPLLLQIYEPLTAFFWPPSEHPNGMPSINEAIGCFLAPAGLVYAVTFGFTFQSAVEKQKALLNNVSLEVSLLDQIIILASQVPLADEEDRMEIYIAVKDEIISIMGQIQVQKANHGFNEQKGPLWKIVPIIRKRRYNNQADTVMAKEMIKNLLKMNTARSERHEAMNACIHPLQWVFLEVLSFFSFFGVLLIKADSYRMELTMCIVTVFSISLLCYVVADLDSPFSGFFKIDLSFLSDILKKTEIMHEAELSHKSIKGDTLQDLNQTSDEKILTPVQPFTVKS